MSLTLKPQQIPFDHEDSCCMFDPTAGKPFVATPAALAAYGIDISACLLILQDLARRHNGIEAFQVFEDPSRPEPLWFIEDGDGGAITALLPSDY